jgi:hypothetical protein
MGDTSAHNLSLSVSVDGEGATWALILKSRRLGPGSIAGAWFNFI